MKKLTSSIIFKIRVIQQFKSEELKSDILEIKTGYRGRDSGFHFEIGKQYLIFASMNRVYSGRKKEELTTTNCHNTGLITHRSKEREIIKPL